MVEKEIFIKVLNKEPRSLLTYIFCPEFSTDHRRRPPLNKIHLQNTKLNKK